VHTAVEKLYGWSVVIDVFHGINHTTAMSVRAAVRNIGPQLHRMATFFADSGHASLDLVCCGLFDMQQTYFLWFAKASVDPNTPVPNFSNLIDMVTTSRASSLAALPSTWAGLVSYPQPAASPARRGSPLDAAREEANAVPTINTQPALS